MKCTPDVVRFNFYRHSLILYAEQMSYSHTPKLETLYDASNIS